MNCQDFELLYRKSPGASGRGLSQSARDHVNECGVCARQLHDEETLTSCLSELAAEMKSLKAPETLAARVLLAYRRELGAPVVSPARAVVPPFRQIGRRPLWIAAAVVVLLLVLGSVGLRLRERHTTRSTLAHAEAAARDETAAAGATPESAEARATKELQVATRPGAHRRLRTYRNSARVERLEPLADPAATTSTESEVATRFIAVGYSGPLNPQDTGQVVRVELPRSAMLSMGWPVNMDRYGELVKADVLLGPDGLARAIRFVQ
jgi:hypothetical protein